MQNVKQEKGGNPISELEVIFDKNTFEVGDKVKFIKIEE